MIVTGLDIGLMLFVLALVFVTVEYREWARRDQDRRIARLRERGRA